MTQVDLCKNTKYFYINEEKTLIIHLIFDFQNKETYGPNTVSNFLTTTTINPNQSLGRKWHLFYYFLLSFVFYKASIACF